MTTDYPRMLFHRTKDPVTVHSREEEEALGAEWRRKIWNREEEAREHNSRIFAEIAAVEIAAASEPEPEEEPELPPKPAKRTAQRPHAQPIKQTKKKR